MSKQETADVNENQDVGSLEVEGSSATTAEQQPNTPDNAAPSGVEQQEAEANPQDTESATSGDTQSESDAGAVDQQAGLDEGDPKLPANAKAGTKKAFDRLLAQKKALEAVIAKNSGQQSVGFGQPPNQAQQQPTVQQPSVQPNVPAQSQPDSPARPQQADPWSQAIDTKTAEYWHARQMFESLDEAHPQKSLWRDAANKAYADAEGLKEQRITARAVATFQQQQAIAARQQSAWGDVLSVNEQLDAEHRFIDQASGMVKPDSLAFQAMTSLARNKFGYTPQQLMADPLALEFCAKDIAWRLNGAVSQRTALTNKQIKNKQRQMAVRVGVESGGDAASAPPSKASAQRAALEKLAKTGATAGIRQEATRKLMALDMAS